MALWLIFSFFLLKWTGNHERNNDEGGSWLVRWMTMSSWGQSCEGWSGLVWQTESTINRNVPEQTFGEKFQFPDIIGLSKNYWLAKLFFGILIDFGLTKTYWTKDGQFHTHVCSLRTIWPFFRFFLVSLTKPLGLLPASYCWRPFHCWRPYIFWFWRPCSC